MSEVTAPAAGENSSVVDVERWSSTKQETPEPSPAESVAANESEPVEAAVEPAKADEPKTEEKKEAGRDWRIDEYYRLMAERRQPAVVEQPKPEPVSADDPKPVWDAQKYADKGGYDTFVEELGEWSARKQFRKLEEKRAQQTAQTEAQRLDQSFESRVKASGIQDWAQVVSNTPVKFSPNPEFLTALKESEQGPQIAYHLAKNPDEMVRFNALSPRSQLIELGKLEARFAQSTPIQTQQPTGISKAPPPVQPLRPRAVAPKNDPAALLSDGSNFREVAQASGWQVQKGRWGRNR